jgi:hypothetical protein
MQRSMISNTSGSRPSRSDGSSLSTGDFALERHKIYAAFKEVHKEARLLPRVAMSVLMLSFFLLVATGEHRRTVAVDCRAAHDETPPSMSDTLLHTTCLPHAKCEKGQLDRDEQWGILFPKW